MRRHLWPTFCVIGLAAGVVPAAQSVSLRDSLQAKAKELYGDAAPAAITFVTLSTAQVASVGRKGGGRSSAGEMLPTAGGGGGGVQTRATQPGDSGTGVILNEGGNQVYLDASPCAGKIMTFTQPYTRTELPASVTCGARQHKQYKFVQK